jgi:hypothetical protein
MNENTSGLLKHGGTVPVLRITPWERDALQLLADGQTRNELSRRLGGSHAWTPLALIDPRFRVLT